MTIEAHLAAQHLALRRGNMAMRDAQRAIDHAIIWYEDATPNEAAEERLGVVGAARNISATIDTLCETVYAMRTNPEFLSEVEA